MRVLRFCFWVARPRLRTVRFCPQVGKSIEQRGSGVHRAAPTLVKERLVAEQAIATVHKPIQ